MNFTKLTALVMVGLFVASAVLIVEPNGVQALDINNKAIATNGGGYSNGVDPTNYGNCRQYQDGIEYGDSGYWAEASYTGSNYQELRPWFYFVLDGEGSVIRSITLSIYIYAPNTLWQSSDSARGVTFYLMPPALMGTTLPADVHGYFSSYVSSVGVLSRAAILAGGWQTITLNAATMTPYLGQTVCLMGMADWNSVTYPTNTNRFQIQGPTGANPPYLTVETDVKVWDGGGADNLASNALNWRGDKLPVAGDTVNFNSVSSKLCTWDLNVDVANLKLMSTFTGTVSKTNINSITSTLTIEAGKFYFNNSGDCYINALTQSGGILTLNGNVHVTWGFTHTAGTVTGNTGKYFYVGGSWSCLGTLSSNTVNLIMTRDGSTFTNPSSGSLNSFRASASVTVNSAGSYIAVYKSVTVDSGKTVTVAAGKTLRFYNYNGGTFTNSGTITGPGLFQYYMWVTVASTSYINAPAMGVVNCNAQLSVDTTSGNYVINQTVAVTYGKSLTLTQGNYGNGKTLTYNMAGYALNVGANLIVGSGVVLNQGSGTITAGTIFQNGTSSTVNFGGTVVTYYYHQNAGTAQGSGTINSDYEITAGTFYYYERQLNINGNLIVLGGVVHTAWNLVQTVTSPMNSTLPVWNNPASLNSTLETIKDWSAAATPTINVYALVWILLLILPALLLGYLVPAFGFQLGIILMSVVLSAGGLIDFWIPVVSIMAVGLTMYRGRN